MDLVNNFAGNPWSISGATSYHEGQRNFL